MFLVRQKTKKGWAATTTRTMLFWFSCAFLSLGEVIQVALHLKKHDSTYSLRLSCDWSALEDKCFQRPHIHFFWLKSKHMFSNEVVTCRVNLSKNWLRKVTDSRSLSWHDTVRLRRWPLSLMSWTHCVWTLLRFPKLSIHLELISFLWNKVNKWIYWLGTTLILSFMPLSQYSTISFFVLFPLSSFLPLCHHISAAET